MCIIIQITTEVRYTVRGREEDIIRKRKQHSVMERQGRSRIGGLKREGVEGAG